MKWPVLLNIRCLAYCSGLESKAFFSYPGISSSIHNLSNFVISQMFFLFSLLITVIISLRMEIFKRHCHEVEPETWVQLRITHIEISFVSLLQTILAQILQETVLSRKYYVSPIFARDPFNFPSQYEIFVSTLIFSLSYRISVFSVKTFNSQSSFNIIR